MHVTYIKWQTVPISSLFRYCLFFRNLSFVLTSMLFCASICFRPKFVAKTVVAVSEKNGILWEQKHTQNLFFVDLTLRVFFSVGAAQYTLWFFLSRWGWAIHNQIKSKEAQKKQTRWNIWQSYATKHRFVCVCVSISHLHFDRSNLSKEDFNLSVLLPKSKLMSNSHT